MSARVYKSISDVAGILAIVLFLVTVSIVGGYAPEGFDKLTYAFAISAVVASAAFSITRWRSTL